jgi:hypothetical protein
MSTLRKILLTILLATIWFYLFYSQTSYERRKPADVDYSPNVGGLVERYRLANEMYFYGGLPGKDTKIFLEHNLRAADGERAMGLLEEVEGGFRIEVDVETNATEKQAEMSLEHEMCHQYNKVNKIYDGIDDEGTQHGAGFQACMVMLAQRGGMQGIW